MTYIPRNWFNGDRITAERLNHIEQGIASASSGGGGSSGDSVFFPVIFSNIYSGYPTCSTTFEQIYANCTEGNKIPIGIMLRYDDEEIYFSTNTIFSEQTFDNDVNEYVYGFSFNLPTLITYISISDSNRVRVMEQESGNTFTYIYPEYSEEIYTGAILNASYNEIFNETQSLPIFTFNSKLAYTTQFDPENCAIKFSHTDENSITIYTIQAPYDDSTGEYDLDAPMVVTDIYQPGNNTPFE